MECNICPRKCNIDRDKKVGFCGVGNNIKLARAALHEWEEPLISGTRGSGTIFFSGCNLKCVFCQNYDVSRGFGKEVSIDRFIDIMKELEDKGAHNINLVTPSHYVSHIISALDKYRPNIPIVYNSSGYESVDTIKRLKGYIDVYLPDLKYSDNALALKYSKAPNYFEIATAAIKEMRSQVADVIDNGLMKSGLIVRHLVLPNALKNTLNVLDWIVTNLDKSTYVSLMGQFVPYGDAKKFDELTRRIKPLEYKIAINKLIENDFNNAFIQDLDSAESAFIPPFNLEGID
ncbi:MAG: radical SAM protein [Clostridia bacterium]|nr:radical SAM protein [Clostridia bacterium]